MNIRYKIGKWFMRFGAHIINDVCYTTELHEELPSESPFKILAQIVCADTEEEAAAMMIVRTRTADHRLAVAYLAYTREVPNGTITDFNQLSALDRRKYFDFVMPQC